MCGPFLSTHASLLRQPGSIWIAVIDVLERQQLRRPADDEPDPILRIRGA